MSIIISQYDLSTFSFPPLKRYTVNTRLFYFGGILSAQTANTMAEAAAEAQVHEDGVLAMAISWLHRNLQLHRISLIMSQTV